MTAKVTFNIILLFFLMMLKASTFQNERSTILLNDQLTDCKQYNCQFECGFEKEFCIDILERIETGNELSLKNFSAENKKFDSETTVIVRRDNRRDSMLSGWLKVLQRWIRLLIEVG